MRYPAGYKEGVRASIVAAAASALRRDGIDGVSIPALMKQVGLTHGGFYAHFRNRNELVAAAVLAAANETVDRVLAYEPTMEAVVDVYLSTTHVDGPGDGCVLAALGTEARSQPAPIRRAFAKAARGFLTHLDRKSCPRRDVPYDSVADEASDETLVKASLMIGAIVLARLVDDPKLKDRIVAATRTVAKS